MQIRTEQNLMKELFNSSLDLFKADLSSDSADQACSWFVPHPRDCTGSTLIEEAFRYLPVPIEFPYLSVPNNIRFGIMDLSVPRVSDEYPFCTEHSLELTRPSRGPANSINSY